MNFNITNSGDNAKVTITFDDISLNEAVKIVERFKELSTLTDIDRTIIDKLRNEGLLNAVKYCKEHTGKGLKEAKEYCEQLKAVHQVVTIIKD